MEVILYIVVEYIYIYIYMRWFCIVESLLVCPCIMVMSSCWCCKRVYNFTSAKVKDGREILHMMFLLHHKVTTLRRFGTTYIYVSGIGA